MHAEFELGLGGSTSTLDGGGCGLAITIANNEVEGWGPGKLLTKLILLRI